MYSKFEYIDAGQFRYGWCRNFLAVSGGTDALWIRAKYSNKEMNRALAEGLDNNTVPVYKMTVRLTDPDDDDPHIGTITEWHVSRHISVKDFRKTCALTGWESSALAAGGK